MKTIKDNIIDICIGVGCCGILLSFLVWAPMPPLFFILFIITSILTFGMALYNGVAVVKYLRNLPEKEKVDYKYLITGIPALFKEILFLLYLISIDVICVTAERLYLFCMYCKKHRYNLMFLFVGVLGDSIGLFLYLYQDSTLPLLWLLVVTSLSAFLIANSLLNIHHNRKTRQTA